MNPAHVAPPAAPIGAYPGPMVAGMPPGGAPGMPRPPFSSGTRPTFNPWDLLQALKRRWLLATVLGVLFAGSAVATSYFLLSQPEGRIAAATAYMYPKERWDFYLPTEESEGQLLARVKDEAALVITMPVVEMAASDPELAANPKLSGLTNMTDKARIDWIGLRVGAYTNEKDTITIVVSSVDNEPWLVPVANAVLRAYVKVSNEREKENRKLAFAERHKRFMENGGEVQERIDETRQRQLAQGAISETDLNRQYDNLRDRMNEQVGKKNAILDENSDIKINMEFATGDLGDTTVTKEEVKAELDADPTYQQQLTLISAMEGDRENSVSLFSDGENNPYIKKLVAELDKAKEEHEEYVAGMMVELRETLAAGKQAEISMILAEDKGKLRKNQLRMNFIDAKIAAIRKELDEFKDIAVDTKELERELSNHDPFYAKFRGEIAILTKEMNAEPRVIAKEEAGQTKSDGAPSPWRKIALAGIVALGAVLGSVSLLEYRVRRIHTTHEVVQGLGIRLLGAIPTWSPRAQGTANYGANLGYNYWTESVDTARTMVTHAAQAESARVVMITSAVSGEGKTSLASHLAGSLARAGHRTLLVDGDLRRPAIHTLFDLPPVPGLCEVLRGQATLDEVIQTTPARGLSVVAAGQCDADALQALAQGNAGVLFGQLKEQFDYVIVDSSPVLAVADALLLGRHADGVLLSILRDVSRMPTVYAAHQRLNALGIRTLGAVVNGAQSERYGMWYASAPAAA